MKCLWSADSWSMLYAELHKIASHPTCPPLSFVSVALPFPQLQGVVKMNSSRFEVLLSLNSFAEMSIQGKHIICGLLSHNRILNIFTSSFIWQKEKLISFSHYFCKFSPEINMCKILVIYCRLFSIQCTPLCPPYFTCNLLLAAFYLICIILIE